MNRKATRPSQIWLLGGTALFIASLVFYGYDYFVSMWTVLFVLSIMVLSISVGLARAERSKQEKPIAA